MTERGRIILWIIALVSAIYSMGLGFIECNKKRKDSEKIKFILIGIGNMMSIIFLSNV